MIVCISCFAGSDMTSLSEKLNYDREVIRVWFCNKRQALKNTIKRMNGSTSSASSSGSPAPHLDSTTPTATVLNTASLPNITLSVS